ncbi:STAS domain-containing protein [Amycolatopsis sp. NPDC004079]|uniref:Anti-sigma factor antagonist n=1 Tax=Amycolatopsis halotolerans TaxID=330083 RepID=A0ABV7QSH8_9PSEU
MSELTDPVIDPPGSLSIDRADRAPAAVLALSGDLDLGTAPKLTAAVAETVTGRPPVLVLDLTEVDFLASAGLTVLLAACREAPAGTEVRIVASGRATLRPIQLTGLEQSLPLYRTLEEALAAK